MSGTLQPSTVSIVGHHLLKCQHSLAVAAVLTHLPSPPHPTPDHPNPRYENTERRQALMKEKGIFHIGMGVSGGEEGARNGAPGRLCWGAAALR
jgi:hypothetical protein